MKFFIAYSRADKDYAATLAAEIERGGVSVFRDEAAWEPGTDWESALRQALESSSAAILELPREGAKGANTAIFEVGAAKALGKKVFVVARGAQDRDGVCDLERVRVRRRQREPAVPAALVVVPAKAGAQSRLRDHAGKPGFPPPWE